MSSQNFTTFIKIVELGRFPIVVDVLKTIMTMRKLLGPALPLYVARHFRFRLYNEFRLFRMGNA